MSGTAPRAGREVYVGVDVGTSGLKVGAFGAAGEQLAITHATYPLARPRPGWAEQDAGLWVRAFERALAELLQTVDGQDVVALCPVGQSPTVVAVDAGGRPLAPAITWADGRAAEQAQALSVSTGAYVNVEFAALPRAMWLRDELPDVYERTRWFFEASDYLGYLMTGVPATYVPHPDLAPWSPAGVAAAGLDPARFPSTVVTPGGVVGPITREFAERTGLNPRAVVVAGTVDAFAHWVGVDLSRHGRVCNIGGTSEGANLSWPDRLVDPEHRVFALPSPFGSDWIVGGSMSNGGSLLDWATRSLFGPNAELGAVLDAVAAVPAGSEGLVALPYLLGERTPIYDPNARGLFLGVGHEHGAPHMTRALMEGAAMGLRQIIEILEAAGGRVDEVAVSGGTSRARVWNQIKADVTNKPVRVPVVHESGVLGAAMFARSGTSGLPLAEVAAEMARFSELLTPNATATAVYDDTYTLFLDVYGRMREPFEQLSRLRHGAHVGRS